MAEEDGGAVDCGGPGLSEGGSGCVVAAGFSVGGGGCATEADVGVAVEGATAFLFAIISCFHVGSAGAVADGA
jgi:hypothetical protein